MPEPLLVPASIHVLPCRKRWITTNGADTMADLRGQELPRVSETLKQAWQPCPQTA